MLRPGDKLILTSDGIHDNLTTDEMENCLRGNEQTEISRIVSSAEARSNSAHIRAKPDDMTAAILTFNS